MKIINYFSLLLLSSIIVLTSCKDDESTTKKYNATDADAVLQAMTENINNDISEITQSEGLVKTSGAINNIELKFDLGLINKFLASGEFKKSAGEITNFSKSILSKVLHHQEQKKISGIDLFESLWGIYTFNSATNTFFFNNNASDVQYIQLSFPSAGASTNNALLTITKLSLYSFIEGGSDFYNDFEAIESFAANLKIDGELISAIDLTIDFNQQEVLGLELALFLKPYTLNITTHTNEKSITNTLTFIKGTSQIASYNLTISFDKQLTDEDKLMLSIAGIVEYREMSANGRINTAALNKEDEPSVEELNEAVSIELIHVGNYIGKVVFDNDNEREIQAYIEFTDGSRKLLGEYFEGINFQI